jgi:putative addiction module component (TIGR02574 family)
MVASTIPYEKVKNDALHLPLEDRSRLASCLIESIDEGDEISDEWLAEIRRRVREMKDGTAKMIPHDEVMANVRARLTKKREARAAQVS